ncbi:MAG: PqqD family protein [Calditrichaeota bacterium]|nr:MAG: PqqD family protein [Calditrichota bacterium]
MLKKSKRHVNFLELVPERSLEWITSEEGHVKLLVPKYGKSSFGVWLAKQLQKPYMYIKLDAIGSAVWKACDGHSTVYEIAQKLKAEFGDDIEPIYDRLGQFFRELERSKFIKWKNLTSF